MLWEFYAHRRIEASHRNVYYGVSWNSRGYTNRKFQSTHKQALTDKKYHQAITVDPEAKSLLRDFIPTTLVTRDPATDK